MAKALAVSNPPLRAGLSGTCRAVKALPVRVCVKNPEYPPLPLVSAREAAEPVDRPKRAATTGSGRPEFSSRLVKAGKTQEVTEGTAQERYLATGSRARAISATLQACAGTAPRKTRLVGIVDFRNHAPIRPGEAFDQACGSRPGFFRYVRTRSGMHRRTGPVSHGQTVP